ncbi:TIGR03016 family PEP-CTERM system-associated outer membrane protein [Thalassotalea maritima]|uniref:TIGR03016 family PEP-CTERM system-associated outer membrane protein n=1 Tax=Thalassotalea maritima TaxID=3242416 RepID=UPI003529477C
MATAPNNKNKYASAGALISLLMMPNISYGQGLQLAPKLTAEIVYSDNVQLTTEQETESLVTLVTPGIMIGYQGRDISLEGGYEHIRAFYSHNHDLDSGFNSADINAQIKLANTGFNLFGSHQIGNISASNSRNALADIVSGDTVESTNSSYGLSYATESSAFGITGQIAFTNTGYKDNLSERKGYNATLSGNSGVASRTIFWRLNGLYNDYENDTLTGRFYNIEAQLGLISNYHINPFVRYYDEDTSGNINNNTIVGNRSLGAGLSWRVGKLIDVELAYNWVQQNNQLDEGQQADDHVSAYVSWQPSPRTKLIASYYKRFFGDAYQGSFSHRHKRLTVSLAYDETLDAFDRLEYVEGDLINVWCLTADPSNIEQCLFEPSDNEDLSNYYLATSYRELIADENKSFTLNKALTMSLDFNGRRNSYQLNVNHTRRNNLDSNNEDEYQSASFRINRALNRHNTLELSTSYNRITFGGDTNNTDIRQQDHYRIYRLAWQQQLSQKVSTQYSAQHVNRDSSSIYNYEENRLSVQFEKLF